MTTEEENRVLLAYLRRKFWIFASVWRNDNGEIVDGYDVYDKETDDKIFIPNEEI